MSNVNDVRTSGVKVTLGATEHTIKFDLNSFAELEERFGSVDEAMKKLQDGSIKGIRTLLWCGLVHENDKLTEKEVGAMVNIQDLEGLTAALTGALGSSLPEQSAPIELANASVEGNAEPSR